MYKPCDSTAIPDPRNPKQMCSMLPLLYIFFILAPSIGGPCIMHVCSQPPGYTVNHKMSLYLEARIRIRIKADPQQDKNHIYPCQH